MSDDELTRDDDDPAAEEAEGNGEDGTGGDENGGDENGGDENGEDGNGRDGNDGDNRLPPSPDSDDPWGGRVLFSTDNEGLPFAYRPGEILTLTIRVGEARDLLTPAEPDVRLDSTVGSFTRLLGIRDVLGSVQELRINSIVAQPNHVYFAHGAGCCPPHPSAPCGCGCGGGGATAVGANPVYASPVYASPVYASPVYASPVYASPVYASPVYASGVGGPRRSSAVPAQPGATTSAMAHQMELPVTADAPEIFVLDTGLAALDPVFRPIEIRYSSSIVASTAQDQADPAPPGQKYLDPAAGHSTFISGLIENVAPGSHLRVHKVLEGDGSGDELHIATAIQNLAPTDPTRSILSLSFGGYVLDQPFVLAQAINGFLAKGGVVVASAGNDASCRPTYPAALPNVIGVGAVGPSGPAPFTNYGPWVSACAPGVDLVSAFFKGWRDESGRYVGWAIWSGTSFAAPLVAGALARVLAQHPARTGRHAVQEVIDAPWLMRIPNLGTVVNVV